MKNVWLQKHWCLSPSKAGVSDLGMGMGWGEKNPEHGKNIRKPCHIQRRESGHTHTQISNCTFFLLIEFNIAKLMGTRDTQK